MSAMNPDIELGDVDSVTAPSPSGRFAGDWRDDDGVAIDQYFMGGNNGPPVGSEAVEAARESLKPVNRVVTNIVRCDPNTATTAIQLFPADPYRKLLVLRNVQNELWCIAAQSFPQPATALSITMGYYPSPQGDLTLPDWTDAVWVCVPKNAGEGIITGLSISSVE